jgi:hypothetical protein
MAICGRSSGTLGRHVLSPTDQQTLNQSQVGIRGLRRKRRSCSSFEIVRRDRQWASASLADP